MNINFNKGLLVKLLIALVALVVVYSVFWFFKLGQVEKQINRIVSEHASNVSIADIGVSGFPFSQKITISDLRFNLPTPALDKRQILVKTLEAQAGIFQSEYVVNIVGDVLVYDENGGEAKVSFNSSPQIKISISDSLIEKLTYQDSGYKIVDSAQKQIYSANSATVNVASVVDENEQVTFTINVNISQMDGFGVLNIYKNVFEKRIIDALKTGEIAIGASVNPVINEGGIAEVNANATTITESKPADALALDGKKDAALAPDKVAVMPKVALANQAKVVDSKLAPNQNPAAQAVGKVATAEVLENGAPSVNKEVDLANIPGGNTAVADPMLGEIPATGENINLENIKSDFALNVEYVLTPNQVQQQNPVDITQVQETPVQYVKTIRINSLSLKNELREVTLNGQVSIFPDDALPSGNISIQISNPSNAIASTVSTLKKLSKEVMVANEINPVDPVVVNEPAINPVDPAVPSDVTATAATANSSDLYQALLQRVSVSIESVVLEVSSKNAVSNGNLMQFDIRREKNLEILINETPVREILGKL